MIFTDARQCETETESSDSDVPLDRAEAQLEILKDNLLKREQEISMLMEGQERVTDPEQSAYAHLLRVYMSKISLKTLLKDTSVFCSTI